MTKQTFTTIFVLACYGLIGYEAWQRYGALGGLTVTAVVFLLSPRKDVL